MKRNQKYDAELSHLHPNHTYMQVLLSNGQPGSFRCIFVLLMLQLAQTPNHHQDCLDLQILLFPQGKLETIQVLVEILHYRLHLLVESIPLDIEIHKSKQVESNYNCKD